MEITNEIASLSADEKIDFEVIDGENLSFLDLDEVNSFSQLIDLT